MKNLDFKMRERFHRREQDENRQLEREWKRLAKMKAAHYSEDEFFDDEKARECGGTPEEIEKIFKRIKELENIKKEYANNEQNS